MSLSKFVGMDRDRLPVLAEGDLLVAGGSFGGVAAALAAAASGHRVILVEPRTYLGREATACLRPFVALPGSEGWPALVQSCADAVGVPFPAQGIVAFRQGDLKTHLEDLLLEAGVRILYASQPVSLVQDGNTVTGVVIGNKSGRQVIRARAVLDATETALLLRLAQPDKAQQAANENGLFYRTLEFDKVGEVTPGPLVVPEALGISGNAVRLLPGSRGEGHWYVECAFWLPAAARDAFDLTEREITARAQTMALAAYLRKHAAGFEKAYLAGASSLLAGPTAPVLEAAATWAVALEEEVLHPGFGLAGISCAETAGPLAGLFYLPVDPSPHVYGRDRAITAAAALGEALGAWLGRQLGEENWLQNMESASGSPANTASHSYGIPLDLLVKEPDAPQRGRAYPQQAVRPAAVPVLREVDVLVVGGGTSGATAAYAAAKNGARTLLVEALPGLGGTGTIGGVHSYWFGRRVGFARQVIDAVEAMHAELGLDPPQGGLLKWNIEAKMHALLRRALDAGVEVLWGAAATGALVEGSRVRGVVVATPTGPVALCADVIIDATGDGDVAHFAGAQVVYGAPRDHVTMWYSLAQFHSPGLTRNNFTSMVDVGNVEDTTRAVLAGRRRVEGYDQGTYVAPRESRHVLGEVVLTLNDQLLKRCWPDTVYVAFSNHDVKGHSSSDWLRIGLIPPNLEIEIPYRALLPRGLEGVLLAGKAISATHDALPAVRMQPDMENLGGVAGTAAAMAVRAGCSLRAIDVQALQRELARVGALPESVLNRALQARSYTSAELETLVEALVQSPPLYSYQDMDLDVVFEGSIPFVEVCCAGPAAVEALKSALERTRNGRPPGERSILAKALAVTGSNAGVDDLIAALHAVTPEEGLQALQAHIRHVQLPPDQGAMPEATNLLYALGMARDARALPVWDHFSALIADTSETDIRDRKLGLFYYVDAVCYGVERLGDPRAVSYLKRIHAHLGFRGRKAARFEVDFFLERQAYLELVIARALARCGDREGFETLIDYLDDARALLAEHAHSELRAITGEDFGKDAEHWRSWLSASASWKQPHPVTEPPEPVLAWNEIILRAA